MIIFKTDKPLLFRHYNIMICSFLVIGWTILYSTNVLAVPFDDATGRVTPPRAHGEVSASLTSETAHIIQESAEVSSTKLGATLVPEANFTIKVPTTGESVTRTLPVRNGQEYLVIVKSFLSTRVPTDLFDGYVRVSDPEDGSASMIGHGSIGYDNAPKLFFIAKGNGNVNINVGSDIPGKGGNAQVQVFNSTKLVEPILFMEIPRTDIDGGYKIVPGGGTEGADISIDLYRYGNLSKKSTYTFQLTPTGSKPLSAADISGGSLVTTVVFDAGQMGAAVNYNLPDDDLAEGDETATLSFAPGGASAELLANMRILGLETSLSIVVHDSNS